MQNEEEVEKTAEELEAEAKETEAKEAEKDEDIKGAIRNGSTNEDIASSFGVDADRIARLRGDVEAEKQDEAPLDDANTSTDGGESTPEGEQA